MNLAFKTREFDNADQSNQKPNSLSVESDGAAAETSDNPLEFAPGEFVVYPAHGVGQILAIEVQTIAGASLEFFRIYFVKSKMSLRVPTQKASRVGMRKLSSSATIERARLVLSETSRQLDLTGGESGIRAPCTVVIQCLIRNSHSHEQMAGDGRKTTWWLTQCRSNWVSGQGLRKTGIFAEVAGDSRRLAPQD
jgi:hypothetical protein